MASIASRIMGEFTMQKPDISSKDLDHLVWRLRSNDTAKHLCGLAAEAIEKLRRAPAAPTEAQIERAIKAGCAAADVHLMCSYPSCTCKVLPGAIRAALTAGAQGESDATREAEARGYREGQADAKGRG